MKDTLETYRGIGLAAPQVGVLKNIIIVDCSKIADDDPVTHKPYEMINPKILEKSGKFLFTESCLSINGYYTEVERSSKIKVQYFNRKGEEKILEANGLLSGCIQHELDHLLGVLFVDRLSNLKKEIFKKKYKKFQKQIEQYNNANY